MTQSEYHRQREIAGEKRVPTERWSTTGLVLFRFVALFTLLYVLTVPLSPNILPDPGTILRPLFEPFATWTATHLFGFPKGFSSPLLSDTTGLYIHLVNLFFISVIGTGVWGLLDRERKEYPQLLSWLILLASYYLAFQLLVYGFNKVFKWQFYLPEPNTLFTTVGETPRDLLYWSVIGSSRPYTVFAGLAEVIPALLLLFRKTRIVGALLALGVMLHVGAINFGFDISVKIHSTFLLFLSLLILAPESSRLYHALLRSDRPDATRAGFVPARPVLSTSLRTTFKAIIIPLILFDVLSPYVLSGNFNDDTAPRPPLHGAYEVQEFSLNGEIIPPLTTASNRWRRFFVHRKGYFIVQMMDDRMVDYELRVDTLRHQLLLKDPRNGTSTMLNYTLNGGPDIAVEGSLDESLLSIEAEKIDLSDLPLLQNEFHWSIDPDH